jgi:hypothetical protein
MKRLITWATPKSIQKSSEDLRWHSKVKKSCKATKGEHNFKLIKTTRWDNFQRPIVYNHYRCPCGKKKIEFVDNPSKME